MIAIITVGWIVVWILVARYWYTILDIPTPKPVPEEEDRR